MEHMKESYRRSVEELFKEYSVDTLGLTEKQVTEMREKHGRNALYEAESASVLSVFLSQLKDFLVIILLVAAVGSAFLGKLESAIVIGVVVTINAILGTVQHVKAEQSLKSLKAMASPKAKVIREGMKMEIATEDVVVGDILTIEAGDAIAADGRIIDGFSLKVNESALTGESESVEKSNLVIDASNLSPGDQKNMVFSGTHATYGRATVIVTSVGDGTEIGRIATLLKQAENKETPLQKNLDAFGKKLAVIILLISAVIFVVNIQRGNPMIDALMFAISLAVAAIPEALSSIVTIVLAIGTRRMAHENAIIRHLHAVEGLGSVSVICSDKTGTLTQNKMTVKHVYTSGRLISADDLNVDSVHDNNMLLFSLLCADAVTTDKHQMGDPTEIALVDLGEKYGIDELHAREKYPRISELPFDSDRKMMSTLHELDGRRIMLTKGAVDQILKVTVAIDEEAGIRPVTAADVVEIERINRELSSKGLRILAFAYKAQEDEALTLEDEKDLTFIGLVAMMDPPREESAQAVAACRQAGIRTVMITGDHVVTASAIAEEIGIKDSETIAMEGHEVETLSDEELKAIVPRVSVYARVSPEHKIRIVKAWQENGHVVAMTGDGVNDAPALKQADIGVAMGITGTEVSKDAASMVLTDDNFATIVKSVANGRSIYGNIKNAVRFLLSGNTAGILAVLYASVANLPAPFAPVHLLFINLLTDSLPAIAIGLEKANPRVMEEKPRNVNEPILTKPFMIEILLEGMLIAIVSMVAFHQGLSVSEHAGVTMAFAVLCLARLVHGFNCRMKNALTAKTLFSNKYSWMAFGLGVTFLMTVLVWSPLSGIFEIAPLTSNQLAMIIGLSLVPLVVVQTVKRLIHK